MYIVQYWNAKPIPAYIMPLVRSYQERNPWAKYAIFDEATATQFISANFSSREVAAFQSCAVPAMQADYFRYGAILALGGAYADADTLCIDSIKPLIDETPQNGVLFILANGNVMNAFFLFKSQGSPFLNVAMDIATANIENRIAEDVWLTTGPGIFSFMYAIYEAGSFSAFRSQVANHEYDRIPPYIDLMCRTLGSFSRLAEIFERVSVVPSAWLDSYVQMHSLHLPYKATEVHWTNVRSSIYRSSAL